MTARPTFYYRSTCTTCRRAKASLDARGIAYAPRNYAGNALTDADLDAIVASGPLKPLVNPKSPSVKVLGLDLDAISEAEARRLILEDNTRMRRPVFVNGNGRIVGYDEAVYATLAPSPSGSLQRGGPVPGGA